jgi:hypothetical protein
LRIPIFHGYSLCGSGSDAYIAELTRCLVRQGHDVQLLGQDRNPAEFDFVDAVGRWPDGRLRIEWARWRAHCTAYLPDIGGGYARQGLATADLLLAGSGPAAEELWEVTRQPDLPARTRPLPPGAEFAAHRVRPPGNWWDSGDAYPDIPRLSLAGHRK